MALRRRIFFPIDTNQSEWAEIRKSFIVWVVIPRLKFWRRELSIIRVGETFPNMMDHLSGLEIVDIQ